jgi:hypothetical protein
LRGVGSSRQRLDRSGTARGDRVEGGGANGDDLDGIGTLHRRQRVAGVDRADEGIGRFDGGDFGDLGHIEQGGDARRDVLAEGGGRGQDVAVAGGVGTTRAVRFSAVCAA